MFWLLRQCQRRSKLNILVTKYLCQRISVSYPIRHSHVYRILRKFRPTHQFHLQPSFMRHHHQKRSATYQEEFLFINHLFPSTLHHQIQIFWRSSVRVCFGCSQSSISGGNIPNPPHDLTITSKMERTFCDPSTGEVRS